MIKFAGLQFQVLTRSDILNTDLNFKFLTTANAEIIVRANEQIDYRGILLKSLSCFDGQIPFLLAKMLNPFKKFEKISGSDLIYDVCAYALAHNERLFLLGGQVDSNQKAVSILKEKFPDLDVSGFSPRFSPYPFPDDIENQIKNHILYFKPHFIFVGFGAYKQEKWIDDHRDFLKNLGVKLAVGSGGTFEFVSGKLPRAPRFLQLIGLEGVFRFFVEPSAFRLKRLFVSLKIFYYAFKN